jgi:hypothetical protein
LRLAVVTAIVSLELGLSLAVVAAPICAIVLQGVRGLRVKQALTRRESIYVPEVVSGETRLQEPLPEALQGSLIWAPS